MYLRFKHLYHYCALLAVSSILFTVHESKRLDDPPTTIFVQLNYPNNSKPISGFSFFEESSYSSRCFQLNASSAEIYLFGEDNSQLNLEVLGNGDNSVDEKNSYCVYEKNIMVSSNLDAKVSNTDTIYKVIFSIELSFVDESSSVYSVQGDQALLKVSKKEKSASDDSHSDMEEEWWEFSFSLSDYKEPLGYSYECRLFVISFDGKDNGTSDYKWKTAALRLDNMTMQAYTFTRLGSEFNYPVRCEPEYIKAMMSVPVVLFTLSILIPFTLIGISVRSVQLEKRRRKVEMTKDLYAMRTSCLKAVRKWMTNTNAKLTRFRFNSQ